MINSTEIQKFYGNKYCQFLALFPMTEIKETKDYYYKTVNMFFGKKELRLFKKSKKVTVKTLRQ